MYNKSLRRITGYVFSHAYGEGKRDRKAVLDSEIDVPVNEVFCLQVYTEKQDLNSNFIFKVIHLFKPLTL